MSSQPPPRLLIASRLGMRLRGPLEARRGTPIAYSSLNSVLKLASSLQRRREVRREVACSVLPRRERASQPVFLEHAEHTDLND